MQLALMYFFFFFNVVTDQSSVNLDTSYTEEILLEMRQTSIDSNDDKMLADVYFKLAELEEDENANFELAFDYFTRSMQYYKIVKDTVQEKIVIEKIADHYVRSGLDNEAIEYYKELLEYYELNKNDSAIAWISFKLSQIERDQGRFEEGIRYLEISNRLNSKIQDTLLKINYHITNVKNYELLNDIGNAEKSAFQAHQLSTVIDDKEMLSKSLYQLGYIQNKKSLYLESEKYLKESLLYESRRPYNQNKLETFKLLTDNFEALEDYRNAYSYAIQYDKLKDSILNNERQKAIRNITTKYETQAKNKEIKLLEKDKEYVQERNNQQKRALTILTVGFGLLSLAIYYIIRFYKQKIKSSRIINLQKEKINQQKFRELEDNIQISSMQSMLEGQEIERERIARDLHDSLGGLLSTIKLQFDNVSSKLKSVNKNPEYNKANNLLDTAVEEVRTISRNLQPGALKNLGLIPSLKDLINRVDGENYPEVHFQYYEFPAKLDTMIALSIYRIIQELLNNAIKYSKANEILIQLTREDDELVILFEDDGIGFDPDNLKRKGMGLENIKSRINYLKGTMNIDSRIGEGTTFLIHVKTALEETKHGETS
jgi:signal transduction histidine kinase